MQFWKTEKLWFFLSEVVLLHQTIIKEWLMFHWKILAHIYLDPLFVKFKKKSLTPTFTLTPTFIRQLRVCKMIIALGAFFHFLGQKWGKGTKMVQNWQKACPHSIWGTTCDMIVIFNIFSTFEAFFSFFENFNFGPKMAKNNL